MSSSSVAAYVSRRSASRVGDRLEHELVVAVRLLGVVALGRVVRALGLLGLAQQLGLVLGEEVELAADELAEAVAAEDHTSSR